MAARPPDIVNPSPHGFHRGLQISSQAPRVTPFEPQQQAKQIYLQNVGQPFRIPTRTKTLQLFEENDAGDRLAKQFFLKCPALPFRARRVVGMEYNRVQESDNSKVGVSDVLPVVTGRGGVPLDILQSRLRPPAERLPVGDALPPSLHAHDTRQQSLV